jgi:hypothetical protein
VSGETSYPIELLRDRGRRIVAAGAAEGLTLRLTGGVAVRERCPDLGGSDLHDRPYHDIDLVARLSEGRKLEALLAPFGLEPDRSVNALFGTVRRIYHHQDGWHIDVFMDRLDFCHRIELKDRLDLHPVTLAPADLLLGKLQIVERNRKDLVDVALLLMTFGLTTGDPSGIELDRILALTSDDWGLTTTASDFLDAFRGSLAGLGFEPAAAARADERAAALQLAIPSSPKSMRWRARERVGRRVRWHKTVEEVL